MSPRYARHEGYVGIARQTVKGTGVVPTHFLKFSGATSMTPQQDFTRHNEGGDSEYPGLTLKQLHKPDGSFNLFARPNVAALLFGLLLGKQVSVGSVKEGAASTTLASRLEAGLEYAHLTVTTGIIVTDVLEIGAAGETELRTVSAVYTTAANGTTTLNGAHAAGVTSLLVADSTSFLPTEFLKIGVGATLEVHKITLVPDGTHITLTEALINAQGTGVAVVEVTNVATLNDEVCRAHAAAAAVVERQAPYTYVFSPCALADMSWATLERSVADLLVDRFTDVRLQQIEISGSKGEPISLAVSYLGIDSTRQATAQTDTYEANDPFIFWEGVYTIEGSDVSSTVTRFAIRLINQFDEADQTDDFKRADIPLIRRDVEVSWEMKFDSIAHYAKTYYGAAAGTASQDSIFASAGTFSVDLTYGADAAVRELKIEVPNLYLTAAPVEIDVGSGESQAVACEGHGRKVADVELVEVTVKSAELARYCDA